MSTSDATSLTARHRAVSRALPRLYQLARSETTFGDYAGHLLLAFALIATTSGNTTVRRRALEMGVERARCWKRSWAGRRLTLNTDTIMHEVIASYASERMGISAARMRRDLQAAVRRHSARELMFFDPAAERVPTDLAADCDDGHLNEPRARRCRSCGRALDRRSPYGVWYYALTTAYFCERLAMPIGARLADVLRQLPSLRPYPRPSSRHYYDCVFAVTHIVYTLNDYGTSRLLPALLPREFAFLQKSLDWALGERDAEMIGEIVECLATFGGEDRNPLIVKGRAFLLEAQHADGGWGDDDDDEYGAFHTVWTAIDALRDYRWRGEGVRDPELRHILRRLAR